MEAFKSATKMQTRKLPMQTLYVLFEWSRIYLIHACKANHYQQAGCFSIDRMVNLKVQKTSSSFFSVATEMKSSTTLDNENLSFCPEWIIGPLKHRDNTDSF